MTSPSELNRPLRGSYRPLDRRGGMNHWAIRSLRVAHDPIPDVSAEPRDAHQSQRPVVVFVGSSRRLGPTQLSELVGEDGEEDEGETSEDGDDCGAARTTKERKDREKECTASGGDQRFARSKLLIRSRPLVRWPGGRRERGEHGVRASVVGRLAPRPDARRPTDDASGVGLLGMAAAGPAASGKTPAMARHPWRTSGQRSATSTTTLRTSRQYQSSSQELPLSPRPLASTASLAAPGCLHSPTAASWSWATTSIAEVITRSGVPRAGRTGISCPDLR